MRVRPGSDMWGRSVGLTSNEEPDGKGHEDPQSHDLRDTDTKHGASVLVSGGFHPKS